MASERWVYDGAAHRYRDLETGRFLPKSRVVDLRDRVTEAAGAEARALAERYASGTIDAGAFRAGMRDAIKHAHIANYVFGRGGVNAMTQADFGRIGGNLRVQYQFLERFIADVEAGMLSSAQAGARAELYINGSTRSYELGQASSWGLVAALPLYPGDNCDGRANCRCSWSLSETPDTINATWRLGGDDPCGPCQGNAASYNPYVVPKHVAQTDRAPVRLVAVFRQLEQVRAG